MHCHLLLSPHRGFPNGECIYPRQAIRPPRNRCVGQQDLSFVLVSPRTEAYVQCKYTRRHLCDNTTKVSSGRTLKIHPSIKRHEEQHPLLRHRYDGCRRRSPRRGPSHPSDEGPLKCGVPHGHELDSQVQSGLYLPVHRGIA